MNDPSLLTPYWSSAFAKQMKPPTLVPYMVALLCMGPCHGQAHTRDPTIGFSPPALLYLRLVSVPDAHSVSLFLHFFSCHVKHFAVSKPQTIILFLLIFLKKWIATFSFFFLLQANKTRLNSRSLSLQKASMCLWLEHRMCNTCFNPRGKSWHFSKCLCPPLKDRQRGVMESWKTCSEVTWILKSSVKYFSLRLNSCL